MKRPSLFRLLAALLALSLGLSACGGRESEALTEESYRQAAADLAESLAAVQQGVTGLDLSDPEQARELLEGLREPFASFSSLTPPEDLAQAHASFQPGCEAMAAYLEQMESLLEETDVDKIQSVSQEMLSTLQAAMADLSEGFRLLEEAEEG